jgi:dihydrofolate reductase/thymidylate synthase
MRLRAHLSTMAALLRPVDCVVAATTTNGIGVGNQLPWSLAGDMARFRELTTRTADRTKTNAVIMGRRTWESIPAQRPVLRKRLNVLLSRDAGARR